MALVLYVKAWLAEQEGQDLVEYALLLGLIALVLGHRRSGTSVNCIQGIWRCSAQSQLALKCAAQVLAQHPRKMAGADG